MNILKIYFRDIHWTIHVYRTTEKLHNLSIPRKEGGNKWGYKWLHNYGSWVIGTLRFIILTSLYLCIYSKFSIIKNLKLEACFDIENKVYGIFRMEKNNDESYIKNQWLCNYKRTVLISKAKDK